MTYCMSADMVQMLDQIWDMSGDIWQMSGDIVQMLDEIWKMSADICQLT